MIRRTILALLAATGLASTAIAQAHRQPDTQTLLLMAQPTAKATPPVATPPKTNAAPPQRHIEAEPKAKPKRHHANGPRRRLQRLTVRRSASRRATAISMPFRSFPIRRASFISSMPRQSA